MWHPWQRIPPAVRTPAFWVAGAAFVGLVVVMLALDQPLRAGGASLVCLQPAGPDRVQQILAGWGEPGRAAAAFQLRVDYLFLAVYSLALSLGCVVAADWWAPKSGWLAAAGPWLGWAAFGAGLADAVENYALMRYLTRPPDEWWPWVVRVAAGVKFALFFPALVYWGSGVVIGIRRLI